jgi:hypothetical protein
MEAYCDGREYDQESQGLQCIIHVISVVCLNWNVL